MNSVIPHRADTHTCVLGNLTFNLQTGLQNVGHPKLRRNQGDVRRTREQRGVSGENPRECRQLLVWGPCDITRACLRLLRGQAVRHHRVAVVQPVHVGVEIPKSPAEYGLRYGLPGKSETWRHSSKLIRILSSERKRRVYCWLRVNLEVFAQTHFQRQLRQSPVRILHVESVIRNRERKSRLSRSLTEVVVFTEREILEIRKFITAERRSEPHRFIRVRAAIIVVRIPGAIKIETEL